MLLYIFVFLLGLYNNQVVETIKSKFKTLKNDTLSETDSEPDTDIYQEIADKDDENNEKSKILNFFKNLK